MKLRHLASIRLSNVDKKSTPEDMPVRLCNYTDVYNNPRITSDLDFMPATATQEQVERLTLRKGDVIITKDSETPDDIAVASLVEADIPNLVCGYHLALLRTTPSVDCRYLYWALASSSSRQQASAAATGITRFGLSRDDIAELHIPTPPLEQQREIAAHLDHEVALIDHLITAKQGVVRALEARWQAAMAAGVEGTLTHSSFRPSRIPWLPAIPSSWREGKLNLIARLGSGHTPSRSHPEWWANPTVPWITTGEVEQFRSDRVEYVFETRELISELGMANSAATLHPAGTVVLCRTASAGYSAIMGRDMATSQDFATWTCGPLILPRFLLLCLRVMRNDLLGRLAMGSTHQTIYMPDIASIKVPLPPIDDQLAVIDAVYRSLPPIDQAISALYRQIGLLGERKQSLITSAVDGQLLGAEVVM